MRPLNHQHEIFTSRDAAEAFADSLREDIAGDESLVIVPDAASAKFIVSLCADGQHVMYV
jgi:hypothetical protein